LSYKKISKQLNYGHGYFVGKLERLKQQTEKLKKKWLKGFEPIKKLTI